VSLPVNLLFWALCLGLSAVLLTIGTASADDHVEDDFNIWVPVFLDIPVNEKWSGTLEVQPRVIDNATEMGTLIVRPSVNYKLTPTLTASLGYGWITNYQPELVHEHRIWQQLNHQTNLKRLTLRNYVRLEERLIQHVDGAALRLRQRTELSHPIRQSRWYLKGYNEIFVNLNDTDQVIQAGFEQNRSFAGLGRHIGKNTRLEGGYLLQYVNRPDPVDDRAGHVLLVQLFYKL
jgi:hypothetical protein